MKIAKVLHNPNAGDGENSDKDLITALEAEGYKCSYLSTKEKGWEKKDWDKIESEDIDFVIVAGGDGTVRKLAGELLDRKLIDKKLPIALLPFGTANNIARTLGIAGGAGTRAARARPRRSGRTFAHSAGGSSGRSPARTGAERGDSGSRRASFPSWSPCRERRVSARSAGSRT